MKIPFCGPSYVYPTVSFDLQRSINLYPSQSEVGTSKDQFIMCPTPGRLLFSTLPEQSIRGCFATENRAFVVSYNTLYEILSDGTFTAIGNLFTFSNPVSMSFNGTELIIVDGTATGGWIFNLDTNIYAQITVPGFQGGVTVTFLGGYFVINRPNTGIYQVSGLYDGLSWNPTEFANAEGSPDNLVVVATTHQQTFLLGGSTTEVVYNAGGADFPLEKVQGVFIEYGCTAPFSVQTTANTILWLGKDTQGKNIVWMASGYQPERISTEAIEYYLSQYDTNNATSYSYQENGHYFYCLNVAGAPTTLVYDITAKQWHERGSWNSTTGSYERDRATFHMYVFGKHLVTDSVTGEIYDQSLDYTNDDGERIRRERTLPYFVEDQDLDFMYFNWFQIDLQAGVGLSSGAPTETDPQIILTFSNDGNTWSNENAVSMGVIGQYNARARWRRLGRGRYRIFRVYCDADVKVYWIAARLGVSKGYA